MPNQSQPNIVLVICDDLGWGDVSCHGNPVLKTPRIDHLASQAAHLTRYCSGPLCTPARAALMTGRHPYRTRAIDTYLGRSMLDPSERTIASLLRDAGYETGIFGKWHLGDCHPTRAIDHGFNEALVHNGGGLRQPGNIGRDSYFDPDLMHNGVLTPYRGYCTDIFTDTAIQFIRDCASKPFFCYLAPNAPHTPLEIGEQWAQPYRNTGLPEMTVRLYGMIANIDANVGRVLDELDRLKLTQNTIFIFTSDHGPCPSSFPRGEQPRYNAKLRGQKATMYEGGLRVPCFMRYPQHFQLGEIDRLANPIDMLPTLAALCSVPTPTDRVIDGRDLTPLLTGRINQTNWPDRTICMQWHRGDVPMHRRNAVAMTQSWKWYSPQEGSPCELYHVANDPGETHESGSEHHDILAQLQGAYDTWFNDVSVTRPHNYAPPRISLGSPAEPLTCLTWQDWRRYPEFTEEGWGIDRPGYWEVQVAQAGRYQFTIDLPPGTKGDVHFRCGPIQSRIPTGDAQSISLNMALAAGPCRLEAYRKENSRKQGIQRIWISRMIS